MQAVEFRGALDVDRANVLLRPRSGRPGADSRFPGIGAFAGGVAGGGDVIIHLTNG